MRVGSVLLMKGSLEEEASPEGGLEKRPPRQTATSLASLFSEPAALLEILGEPILHRIVEVLRRGNVELIYLVTDERFSHSSAVRRLTRERIQVLSGPSKSLPALVETAVKRCARHGMEHVVLLETSAYIELDVKDFLQAHCSSGQPVTLASDDSGMLPMALVNSSDADLASILLQRKLLLPQPTGRYLHPGYVNRLYTAQDLRKLAQDALEHRCRIRPNGEEVSPGVWIASTACVHPSARLVGPAYLGPNSRLRSGVLLSDCATIERNCIVERGTVVKNSSILGGTYLGVCLDVTHTVVNQRKLVDIQRNVAIDVMDSLIGASSISRRYSVPSFWATMAPKGGWSLRGARGKFGAFLPKQETGSATTPARLTYAPAETWGTLKPLSRADSTSILVE